MEPNRENLEIKQVLMQFSRKDVLDMESLSADEITTVLDTAERMKEISERPIKKVPTLRGKTVVLFFL